MKYTKNILPLIVAFALLGSIAVAQDGDAGQAGELLRSGIGARSFAMGRAYTVMPAGGEGLVWNPAGLGKLGRWELHLMHAQGYVDSRLEYGSFAIPIGNLGAFGVGFANEGVSKIDGRDQYNRPTEEFSYGESVAMFGWGRAFLKNKLYAGLTGKYVMKKMGEESASGLGGFDIGLISKDLAFRWRFGAVVENLGAGEIAGDAYPMTVRGGVGYALLRDLYITADGELVSGRGVSPRIGAEYMYKWLAVRAGFDVMKPELTFGLGFMIDEIAGKIAGTYPRLDYAGGALAPVGMSYARLSLTVMGEKMRKLEDIEGDPCQQLSLIEPHLNERGFEGAKANLIYGECLFRYEWRDASIGVEPHLEDAYPFFHDAYEGKYGANWDTEVVTDSLARTIFSQRTHYMYAETRMARGIDEEAKALVEKLIAAGGDSAQYDLRLQYDLAYIQERLGEDGEAVSGYTSIAEQSVEKPVRVLALYRGARILRDTNKTRSKDYLETLITEFGTGFWDENGERVSYPMFPKYRDNSVVDDATLLLGDIIFSMAQGDEELLRQALGLYLDVLIFYPEMDKPIRVNAAEKAAECFKALGNSSSEAAMRQMAASL